MKVEPRRIESFLRKPDPAARAVLVYGPDAGLVRERAEALARTVVPDLADPFRVAELTGRTLAGDPARLPDEAAAIAFGGGRRVLRVRDAGEESAAPFAAFLDAPAGDALVVVEAGDLGRASRLRSLFEGHRAAAAIACYADDSQSLEAVIESSLAQEKITIAPDALAFLVENLGGDRGVTRSELGKLALYAGPGGHVTLADAEACIGDSAALSLDAVALAVAGGDLRGLLAALDRAFAEGGSPVAILRAVARHFQRLHLAAALVARGETPDKAMAALKPPIFYKARDAFRAQLRRWPLAWIAAAITRLNEAEIACKSTGMPDEAVCTRTLMEIARAVGRR